MKTILIITRPKNEDEYDNFKSLTPSIFDDKVTHLEKVCNDTCRCIVFSGIELQKENTPAKKVLEDMVKQDKPIVLFHNHSENEVVLKSYNACKKPYSSENSAVKIEFPSNGPGQGTSVSFTINDKTTIIKEESGSTICKKIEEIYDKLKTECNSTKKLNAALEFLHGCLGGAPANLDLITECNDKFNLKAVFKKEDKEETLENWIVKLSNKTGNDYNFILAIVRDALLEQLGITRENSVF